MNPKMLLVAVLSLLGLSVIWAQVPITGPMVITTSGEYVLAADIVIPDSILVGIDVATPGVTITNPDGYSIRGRRLLSNPNAFDFSANNLQAGVRVAEGVAGVKIVGLKTDSLYAGIELAGSNSTIEGLSVLNCKYGVMVSGIGNTITSASVVESFSHQFFGVYLADESRKTAVVGGDLSGLAKGIVVMSANNLISNNTVNDCIVGIELAGSNNEVSGTAGLCKNRGIEINPPHTGNHGTANTILGQFYDPAYPLFNPHIVGGTEGGNSVLATLPEVRVGVTNGAIEFSFGSPFGRAAKAEVVHYSGEPYPPEWLPRVTRETDLVSAPVIYFEREDGDVTGLLGKPNYKLNFHVIFYNKEERFVGDRYVEVATPPATAPIIEVLSVRLVAWPDSMAQGPGEYRIVSTIRNIGTTTGEVAFYTANTADGIGSEEGYFGSLATGEVREVSTRPLTFGPGSHTIRAIADVNGVFGAPVEMSREILIAPAQYTLAQNYPNPFNPTTAITYAIPVANSVTVAVYNATGTQVRTLVDEYKSAGTYSAIWDSQDDNGRLLPSGIYFCRMEAGGFAQTRKMTLMK